MASIVTKTINGREYIYLVTSIRKRDKIIQKTIKYIGKKRPILQEELDSMNYSYKNKDWILNEFKDHLSYQKHEEMKQISKQYQTYFNSLDEISAGKEKEKFLTKFITNSNALEGSTLTIKETFNYLFNDISPKNHNKKELHMATNLLKAWNYVEQNKNRLPNKNDLIKLHQLVNYDIEDESTLGRYKKVQNYIGNIYTTSFLFVEEKMEQWFNWIKKSYKLVNDFEISFQSHIQFEMIHPFVDGNGRIGRLVINWLLMYKKLSPLAISVNKRGDYLEALENSRKGKIEAICEFCYQEYKNQYQFVL